MKGKWKGSGLLPYKIRTIREGDLAVWTLRASAMPLVLRWWSSSVGHGQSQLPRPRRGEQTSGWVSSRWPCSEHICVSVVGGRVQTSPVRVPGRGIRGLGFVGECFGVLRQSLPPAAWSVRLPPAGGGACGVGVGLDGSFPGGKGH